MTGVSALVYGIIEEPVHGWTDARVLSSLIAGAVVLAAFTLVELRRRRPLVDLRLFLDRRFTWSTVAFVAVGFAMTGLMFVMAPYLQVVVGNDAQGTGIRMLPMIGGLMLGAISSGVLTVRLGTKAMVAGGLAVTTAGVLLLSRVGVDTGYGMVAAALVVMGLGMGLRDADRPGRRAGRAAGRPDRGGLGAHPGAAADRRLVRRRDPRQHPEQRLPGRPERPPRGSAGPGAGSCAGQRRRRRAVAQHLPAPVGGPLVRAAQGAYVNGMAEVLLMSAGTLIAVAVLVALFLPSQVAAAERWEETPADEASPASQVA